MGTTASALRERSSSLAETVLAVALVTVALMAALLAAGETGTTRLRFALAACACLLALASPLRRLVRGRIGRTVGTAVLSWAVALLLIVAIGPRLFGYQVMTVLSDSMHPTYGAGDLILVRTTPTREVRVGDVIAYHAPVGDRQVVAHRIVRIVSGLQTSHPVVETKGDANDAPDPWSARLENGPAWRYTATVPHAGAVLRQLRRPLIHQALLYGGCLLLLAYGLASIWRPRHRLLAEPLG